MSNVYILPRNFATTTEIPVAFQQGQRPIKMIKTGTVGGRILNERRTVRLQGMPSRSTNSTRRVLITPVVARQGQQNASRANYQFQPIAPATSELIPLQPAHLNGERTFSSFAPQQPIFIQENQQFSEEDNELDIGEVYKLLDESAGQRVNEFVNLPKRRERLTNLTLEQKMLRRKQKNRIAAQAARDRKKETNKRLEETLKRALQEIRRLRGELKFLQAQNSQLLAIKNGQNIEGKITQPQEHVFQPMPLFLPKQEILMSQAGHEQYFDSFQASAGRNKMKQNSQSSDKSSILSTNPSHQPVVVNTSLHQASPQSDNSSPLQQGSLGSAESFNDLLPWERESSPEVRVKETEKVMEKSKLMKRNKDKMPLMTIGQKAIRMACMIKVFTALWSIVCEKRETSKTNKSCNKSSTNFLKKWTFQSMWTASATKSLKKALLRRMWLMDNAKLLRLCKSPQRQLVANLLMRTNLRSKYRLKQESIRKNSTLAQMSSNIYVNNYSPLNEEELSSSTESTDEEDYQIVPQLH